MTKVHEHRPGFTLVELVLVIALSGIIFLGLSQAVLIVLRSWDIALAGTNLVGQSEVVFDRMMRDIRQIKSKTSLITATSNDIKFTDINDNSVEYKVSSGQLLKNTNVAMDNVTSLSFEYFDKNGTALASPTVSPSSTNVRTVRATITTTSSTQSLTLESTARLRNTR